MPILLTPNSVHRLVQHTSLADVPQRYAMRSVTFMLLVRPCYVTEALVMIHDAHVQKVNRKQGSYSEGSRQSARHNSK